MEIPITIPDGKINEFREGFLKINPIPLDEAGNPKYTQLVWFKYWLRKLLFDVYAEGKRKIAKEEWHENYIEPEIDEEVISDKK